MRAARGRHRREFGSARQSAKNMRMSTLACSSTHAHAHMLKHTCPCTHTQARMFMHTGSCTHAQAHMFTHTCSSTHAQAHMFMRTCSSTHVHTHRSMHTRSRGLMFCSFHLPKQQCLVNILCSKKQLSVCCTYSNISVRYVASRQTRWPTPW